MLAPSSAIVALLFAVLARSSAAAVSYKASERFCLVMAHSFSAKVALCSNVIAFPSAAMARCSAAVALSADASRVSSEMALS